MTHGDPYYFHSSDYLRIILVSQPLTGDNFNFWCRDISMALDRKNKIGLVNRTIPRLEGNNSQFRSWMCNNGMVSQFSFERNFFKGHICCKCCINLDRASRSISKKKMVLMFFQLKRIFLVAHKVPPLSVLFSLNLNLYGKHLRNFDLFIHVYLCEGVQHIIDHLQNEYILTLLMVLNESFNQVLG